MFFLIRMAFWLSVVLVLLPSGGATQTAAAPSAEIGAVEAVSAASATVGDMRRFCTRQPEACALGSQAAGALRPRAQGRAPREARSDPPQGGDPRRDARRQAVAKHVDPGRPRARMARRTSGSP